MRFRIGVTLVTLLATMAALFVWAGMAAAATKDTYTQVADPTDPQNTNIPYLAWAGETVKVTKCLNFYGFDGTLPSSFNNLSATMNISGWSGTDMAGPNTPFFLQSNTQGITVTGSYIRGRGLCWSALITSEKPGLATLKLAVNDPGLERYFTDSKSNGGQGVLFEHDFLVIWMQSQAPKITEVPTPGDPAGDGNFKPVLQSDGSYAFEPGLIQALVKGTFPLLQNWSGLVTPGGNNTVTLPDDWAWLQDHFAMDASPLGSQSPGAAGSMYGLNRWDIHDDDLATEGHTTSSFCLDQLGSTIDAVDNCLGSRWSGWGAGLGPFSNIFGGTDSWAVGPFDPIRADQTLLSDGKVDAGDAPMPALRVDFAIGAASTVGTLSSVDKTDIYIRDASKDPGTAHNLYAPFYKAYIPAAWGSLNNPTSGVYGASFANNYASFLTQGFNMPSNAAAPAGVDSSLFQNSPMYSYWNTFTLKYQDGYNNCYNVSGEPFPLPTGDLTDAVYTDEHGEAYVQFNPNEGNVLNPDTNGRCDIYTGSLVGNATITATSVYPDQVPTWDGSSKLSNTLTKTVNFDPSKVLACVPKATNEAYCVETVKDLAGNPIAGAPVEFSAQAAVGSAPTLGADATDGIAPYDTTGQGGPSAGGGAVYAGGFVDLTTNSKGQAGIYVHSSTNACVDVTVENVGTRNGGSGITRDVDFNPTSGKACTTGGSDNSGGGSGGSGGGGNTSGGGSGSTSGGGAVVLANPVALSAPAPTVAPVSNSKPTKVVKLSTLASAKVVKTLKGRFLSVRVNGTAKTAKLRITLINKNGTSRIVLRTVKTNRVVRIANLKLAPSIKSVRVALA